MLRAQHAARLVFARPELNFLEAAKRYVALGWPVLALRHGGKEPFAKYCPEGVKNATRVDAAYFQWFSENVRGRNGNEQCNIGISCESLVVIDIDPRNGGNESMAELTTRHGKLPPTPVARTGSGGHHYLFRPNPSVERGSLGKAYPGVDVKKKGGYIVAAPSVTVGPYRWLRPPETPLAELPDWLLALLRRPEPVQPVLVKDLADVTLDRRIARAQAYLERVAPAVSGQGGSTHTFVTAQHVALGFALSESAAYQAMHAWNLKCSPPWSESELRKKIRDALQRGEIRPGSHL